MSLKLTDLAGLRAAGRSGAITSVCSAHPLVLRAALRLGRETGATVLIEATCNQVNHQGGYTGMTPADFARKVRALAKGEGCPEDRIILGGDHLGPNPWRHLPAEEAMAEASAMMADYVAAGFNKIHLDCSMGCAGEAAALDDETTATRAAALARVAEAAAREAGLPPPLYVIGTEVPPPGGADHEIESLRPTDPAAALRTVEVHRKVFAGAELQDAFTRVIALVVQPGVEFGNHNVIPYDRAAARGLTEALGHLPALVFEAHSTDYQGQANLTALVEDGHGILKVGPELTFVLREALYGLDLIASDLDPAYGDRPLKARMEEVMQADPGHWERHYPGAAEARAVLRHYSLSDRIRYYWPRPEAEEAVARLAGVLAERPVPLPLLRQHLPGAAHFAGQILDVQEVVIDRVTDCLRGYHAACHPGAAQ